MISILVLIINNLNEVIAQKMEKKDNFNNVNLQSL